MELNYEIIPDDEIEVCRDLCNELMKYQKEKAVISPELFDTMNFDTRMVPSVYKAMHNYIVVVKDRNELVGYVYANISPKGVYRNDFATFFDMNSIQREAVGCLSQFYIKEKYRQYGVGSKLFNMSMDWLSSFEEVDDYFIFVSSGNDDALSFYQHKGFTISHEILDGFITVLRSKKVSENEHNHIF
ncbi:GNAT family N-acetyltransferase [Fictibacillus phosphorivorans]|uniref:GNAT family N-acetyltransferase n=1 Tax=Fictibacillus phosphorivorans TaxID=1221500 RepID=UPI0012938EEF|nr:GNAT family N-acetyltransferase [Fictibacillus phosphorivorans]MQR97167.1 GNAT family N-acetyltransferase [Fictibacillus phosphorivorans]